MKLLHSITYLLIAPVILLQTGTAFAQRIDRAGAQKAALELASRYISLREGKYYLLTEQGTLRQYNEKPRMVYLIPGPSGPSGVSDSDVLNGVLFRGETEFSLGSSGRTISSEAILSQWRPSSAALKFEFSYRGKEWKITDETVYSDLFGSFSKLKTSPSCDLVQDRMKKAQPPS
jgi:hypothetical protein